MSIIPLVLVIACWAAFSPVLAMSTLWYWMAEEPPSRDRNLARYLFPVILLAFTCISGYIGKLLIFG
jgi:hypothetical protein